jgi:lysozyme
MNTEKLAAQLIIDEGKRSKIYLDTASPPKWTGGVGRNLTDRAFSDDEIALMLKNDIAIVEAELDRALPWWRSMSEARQNVLANCCFNMGINRLLGFVNALAMMKAGRWDAAAAEMLNSVWAKQVGQRAIRLAAMMRKGEFL